MTASKITAKNLKKFHARADVKAAIAAVKAATAAYEKIAAHVKSYIEPAFAAFAPFTHENTGARITRAKDLYLIPDSQEEQCHAWYAHCDKLHAEHGYSGLEPGQCPALTAEHEKIKAENALLKLCEEFTGAAFVNLDHRKRALELFLNPPE